MSLVSLLKVVGSRSCLTLQWRVATQNRPPPQSTTTLRQPTVKAPTPINQRKFPGIKRNNNRPSPSTPSTEAGTSRTETTHHVSQHPGDTTQWEDAFEAEYAGLSADQVFKRVSSPPAIPGLEEWGIPPPTGEKPSPALQVRSPDYVMSEGLMYVGK